MTRNDYEKIAGILAAEYALNTDVSEAHNTTLRTDHTREGAREAIENITASLADMLVQDNPRFNRALFYRAVLGRGTIRP